MTSIGLLIGALALTAAGCGDDVAGSVAPAAGPSSSDSQAPSETSSVTPSPTVSPPEEVIPTDSPETPDVPPVGETTGPPVLPPDAAGRPLTLSNIFKYPDAWKDGRFDVADRKQATGIGGVISYCGVDTADVLELRLANNFSKLTLQAAQSNSSESSEQTMFVRIDANGQYRDQKQNKLNQITSFSIPVQKVNALKISVYLDGPKCGMGSVEAVLMNLVLS